jgi:hypothetical protein
MDRHAPPAPERSDASPGNLNISTFPQHGDTALFDAARGGHVEALRLLLESKAEINAANKVHCSSWSQCMCGMRHGAEKSVLASGHVGRKGADRIPGLCPPVRGTRLGRSG